METVTTTRITAREAQRQIELGVPKRRVARLLNVTPVTLWRWLKSGKLDRMAEAEAAPEERAS